MVASRDARRDRNARYEMPARVTMRDVAERCGVSSMTVSRVLNGGPEVSPATRRRIEDAIAELGYRPSALARGLVRQRSRLLGVITAGIGSFGVGSTLTAVCAEAQSAGFGLLIREVSAREGTDLSDAMAFMADHHVEAVLIAAPDAVLRGPLPWAHAGAPGLPTVVLRSWRAPGLPQISVDNRGGGRAATAHLVSLGRRRIGHVSGPHAWIEPTDRSAGWRDALREADLAIGPEAAGDWSSASGHAALAGLLAADRGLDAVFCANDQMALGLLRRAAELGIRVPDDVAVVGFDDIPEARDFQPPLTTMRQDTERLGREGVLAALRLLGGERDLYPMLLNPELVVRASTDAGAGQGDGVASGRYRRRTSMPSDARRTRSAHRSVTSPAM
jgi:LacI family transcriptional regulator